MAHLKKVQWLVVLAAVAAVAVAAAGSQGLFTSNPLVITAVAYEDSLYLMEDGEITAVIALSPNAQVVPEWDGEGFVFREMTEGELEVRAALLEDVFSILLADEEFGALVGEATVEVRGLFFSPPSDFLDEREKYSPLVEGPPDHGAPEGGEMRPRPPSELESALRDILPDFVFFRGPGPEVKNLYVLLSIDSTMYECALDMRSGTVYSYQIL